MSRKHTKRKRTSNYNKKTHKSKKKNNKGKNGKLPYKHELTLGQKASDAIATFGGSWWFLILFGAAVVGWIILNSFLLATDAFDQYPYILLNLGLSLLSATQAPIILMAQNRQTERDRGMAKYDYQVNRKAEREIQNMQRDLNEIKGLIKIMCSPLGDQKINAAKKKISKKKSTKKKR
jgi:uncharacterized membrane protein